MPSKRNRKRAAQMIAEIGYDRALSIARDGAENEDSTDWLYLYQAILSLGIKSTNVKKMDWLPQFSVINTHRMPYQYLEQLYDQYKLKVVIGRDKDLLSSGEDLQIAKMQGTSIFSPAIAHTAYSWFSQKNDSVFDPFCGGPVRGVVANLLERNYLGIDIRNRQIEANKRFFPEYENLWQINDATKFNYPQSNMIFTCPPYYNLEVYSESENDLSAQDTYKDFLALYKTVIKKCCNSCNGYIVFVVGNIRDDAGFLLDLPGDTVKIFDEFSFGLYNEIIIYAVGSAAARINFINQKVTNVHQEMLVFKSR